MIGLDFIILTSIVSIILLQIIFMILGYTESAYTFRGYQVKHIVFFGYILGRVLYKILNIQLTKGD